MQMVWACVRTLYELLQEVELWKGLAGFNANGGRRCIKLSVAGPPALYNLYNHTFFLLILQSSVLNSKKNSESMWLTEI